ncbi:MAG TPA: hypothetical protein K8V35_05485 [Aliicoccus persicus]|uniref:Uncharacterized protein n=1 Tax=Aliicoccus persicus TaxID=930138 RepID=A0A921JC25_9STAP|nr:hypothetical protein [Aliicoccus persicus]
MNLKQYKEHFNNIYDDEYNEQINALKEILPKNPHKIIELPISKGLFFYVSSLITIDNEGLNISGNVEKLHKGNSYISYNEMNNDFNKPPENHSFGRELRDKLSIYINIYTDPNLKVIPILVLYSSGDKMKTTRLSNKSNVIDTREYDQCRITFKVIGYGHFLLKSIKVRMF